MNIVQGRCPACRGKHLFLGEGGHVTCSLIGCPNPTAADDLLNGPTNTLGARIGWFANTSHEQPGKWQPVIETNAGCHSIDTWFDTEADCQQFIHDYIAGHPCIDNHHDDPEKP